MTLILNQLIVEIIYTHCYLLQIPSSDTSRIDTDLKLGERAQFYKFLAIHHGQSHEIC